MQSLVTFGASNLTLPTRTLGPGKAVALLAYLSAAPTRSIPRRNAFHLLYGVDSPHHADAFRQLLASLRKLLPGTFVTSGDLIQLSEPLPSDRQTFLDAVARGDHDAALALYTAEFFDPFDEPGCDGFRRWAQEERLRLRRRFEFAAESVMRRQLAQSDWAGALATAKAVAERFPALPVSARLLTEALILSGRAGDVRSTLAELGTSRPASAPQARTLDLLLDALTGLARAHGLADPRRPLLGREEEFRTLLEAWNAARAAAGATILIGGGSGAGKSRLLANFALRLRLETPSVIGPLAGAEASDTDNRVARQIAASILPLPGALGTTPLHYVVLKRLAEGAPPDDVDSADRHERMIVDAITDGLRAASEEAPVVLLVDDPGDAESTSVRRLGEISARLRSARVLLVIASRHPLTQVIETSSREQVMLGGLDLQDTAILIACAGATRSPDDATALYAATGGLPGQLRAALDASAPSSQPAGLAPPRPVPTVLQHTAVPVRAWHRRPLTRLVSAGIVASIGLITTLVALRSARASARQESFSVLTWQGDSVSTVTYVIGDDDTATLTPRISERLRTRHWPLPRVPDRVRVSPDARTIAAQIETDGPNSSDIMGVVGDSAVDLVTGPLDDATPEWSPDGGLLAFSSNRWSDTGFDGCDIGIRSTKTKTIWRITSGPDCDLGPRWTADGLGIAFLRQFRARNGEAAICSMATFTAPLSCLPIDSSLHHVELIGWRSATSILYSASSDTSTTIYTLDLTKGASTPLIREFALVEAELSPSRNYIACWCSTIRDSLPRITLIDLNGRAPLYEREVAPDAPFRQIAWHARSELAEERLANRDALLQRLDSTITASARAARLTDTLATARQMMRDASVAVVRAARDMPLPPTPAESLDAVIPAAAILVEERWTSIDTARWIPFGLPRPRADRSLGGLDPGGDGSYLSGLYLRAPFSAPGGFVVEARVTVPISLPFWQGITLFAESERYAQAMRSWPHGTGTWTIPKRERYFESGIQYPGQENGHRATRLSLNGAGGTSLVPISPAVGDGREVVLRVQYGADSLMTVFANGLQVAQRRYAPTRDGQYRLFVHGHSVETKVRVRRLRVWRLGARDPG